MSVVANVAVNVDARNAIQRLRDVQGQAAQTERAFEGLRGAVTKLAGAFAAIQGIKFVFAQAAEIQTQTRSLEVLVGSAEKARNIIKQLQDIGAVTPFTSTELIESAKRLQAFGVETGKVVETTRRLADVSGATGAELQGLVTAYGQVQAKGRLQGEELLQFQERGVALQKVLKEEYKLSGDEFQKALSKGQISAEAVEYAVKKLTDAGGKYANGAIAQSDTLAGKLSTLQDSFQRLAQNIGKFFEPVFKFLIEGITAFINRLNDATLLQDEISARNQAVEEARKKFGRFNVFAPGRQEFIQQRTGQILGGLRATRGTAAPKAPTVPTGAPPPLLTPTGADGTTKAAREAKKLADEIKRSLELGDQLFIQFSRQAVLLGETSELERQRLQIQYDYQDRAKQISELKNAEQRLNLNQLNDEIRRLENRKLDLEILKEQLEIFGKIAGLDFSKTEGLGAKAFGRETMPDGFAPGMPQLAGEKGTAAKIAEGLASKIKELKDQLDPIALAIKTITDGALAIGDAFSTAFGEVITGAKSTQEALADAFQAIGKAFISMALEIIAKQMTLIILQTIFNALSGMGGVGPATGKAASGGYTLPKGDGFAEGFTMPKLFADGGFVTRPTTAMVGEGGEPEYVIPQSKMATAMSRYSRGARGASVIPGSGGATESGGAGAPVATAPIDVRYTVERINNVDYVTAAEFQQGMRQAAEQGALRGEQRTLANIRQNTTTRRRLGL